MGDEIRSARQARGMSQAELAKAIKRGLRTIGRLERGEIDDSQALGAAQRYLRIGPYALKGGDPADPPLSMATFTETLAHLARLHGQVVRQANTPGAGVRISQMDELPPEVAELPREEIIGVWDPDDTDDTEAHGD